MCIETGLLPLAEAVKLFRASGNSYEIVFSDRLHRFLHHNPDHYNELIVQAKASIEARNNELAEMKLQQAVQSLNRAGICQSVEGSFWSDWREMELELDRQDQEAERARNRIEGIDVDAA